MQSEVGKRRELYWPMLFQQVVYWAWSARNELIHKGSDRMMKVKPEVLIQQALLAQELNTQKGGMGVKQVKYLNWEKPPQGWIKLNVDGASQHNPGEASAGGILRDEQGSWLAGFSANIGKASNVAAELWVILLGLKLG